MSVHMDNIKSCEIFCSHCVAINQTQLDYVDPQSPQDIGFRGLLKYFCKKML